MKYIVTVYIMFLLTQQGIAQIQRSQIWGIAKMTYMVSDFKVTRDYYEKFLGFSEAFSYNSDRGKVISFKVNDRQFLEFLEDKNAKQKSRLVAVSLETENTEQMRIFLKGKGIEVDEITGTDGAGNEVIKVKDSSGVPVEFIKFSEKSPHILSKGKYLSESRISKRIHHAGLYNKEVLDKDPFYVGVLGFREIWRFPDDPLEKVQMNYLQIPECTEFIEHYPSDDINFSHPCFVVEDMQETIYSLKERRGNYRITRPVVGKGKRWILNLTDPDGIKIEFTEIHTIW